MKLYVRELPQKQYHYQSYGYPPLHLDQVKNIKPGDEWLMLKNIYHVDKVQYSKRELYVYATKTKTDKLNSYFKKGRKNGTR